MKANKQENALKDGLFRLSGSLNKADRGCQKDMLRLSLNIITLSCFGQFWAY
jgi:hypothetical protein